MGGLAERFGLDLRLVLLVLYSTPLTALLVALAMTAGVILGGPQVEVAAGNVFVVFGVVLAFAVMALPMTLPGAAVGWVLGWLAAGPLRLAPGGRAVVAGATAGLGAGLALGLGAGNGLGRAMPVLVMIGGPAALSGGICAWALWRNKGRMAARGTE